MVVNSSLHHQQLPCPITDREFTIALINPRSTTRSQTHDTQPPSPPSDLSLRTMTGNEPHSNTSTPQIDDPKVKRKQKSQEKNKDKTKLQRSSDAPASTSHGNAGDQSYHQREDRSKSKSNSQTKLNNTPEHSWHQTRKLLIVAICGALLWSYPSLAFKLFKFLSIAALGHVCFSILYLWREQSAQQQSSSISTSNTAAAVTREGIKITETPLFRVFGCDVVLRSSGSEDEKEKEKEKEREGIERLILRIVGDMVGWVSRWGMGVWERRVRAVDANRETSPLGILRTPTTDASNGERASNLDERVGAGAGPA